MFLSTHVEQLQIIHLIFMTGESQNQFFFTFICLTKISRATLTIQTYDFQCGLITFNWRELRLNFLYLGPGFNIFYDKTALP